MAKIKNFNTVDIIDALLKAQNMRHVKKEFGCGNTTVYHHMAKAGVIRDGTGAYRHIKDSEIISALNAGLSMREIADKFSVHTDYLEGAYHRIIMNQLRS